MARKYHTNIVTELKLRCKTRRYGHISTSVPIRVMRQSSSISPSAMAMQPAVQSLRSVALPKYALGWPWIKISPPGL